MPPGNTHIGQAQYLKENGKKPVVPVFHYDGQGRAALVWAGNIPLQQPVPQGGIGRQTNGLDAVQDGTLELYAHSVTLPNRNRPSLKYGMPGVYSNQIATGVKIRSCIPNES